MYATKCQIAHQSHVMPAHRRGRENGCFKPQTNASGPKNRNFGTPSGRSGNFLIRHTLFSQYLFVPSVYRSLLCLQSSCSSLWIRFCRRTPTSLTYLSDSSDSQIETASCRTCAICADAYSTRITPGLPNPIYFPFPLYPSLYSFYFLFLCLISSANAGVRAYLVRDSTLAP